jgi:hypothetical protein
MRVRVFTSIIANYIPKARVLARSIKKLHPEISFHLVLAESRSPPLNLKEEPFDSVELIDSLGIPNLPSWIFKHTIVEASTAVKGPALVKLLGLPDTSAVLYFDPDMVIFDQLDELLANFHHASILLTPHQTEPEETDKTIIDNEICSLQHGIYNLGFVGVKNSSEGVRFAQWWARRLLHYCYDDKALGIFTDQKWCDFVPAFFDDSKILREPQYNVCTWNLTHRTVTGSLHERIMVNGRPLCFYHFSGFDSGAQLDSLAKYAVGMPLLFKMRNWYIEECDRQGQITFGGLPWQYATFSNGEAVSGDQRWLYRNRADLQKAYPDPFDASSSSTAHSFLAWFKAHAEPFSRPAPSASEANRLRQELAAIKNSRSWKLVSRLQRVAIGWRAVRTRLRMS